MKKKKERKEKRNMAIIFWLALRFLFCLFVFSRKKKAQIDNRAWQRSIFRTKNCSRSYGCSLLHSQFLPTLPPPPLPFPLSKLPPYESHRTIFTDLGAKSQVMTGYLPLPKPWTLKLTKICIFFDEMIRSFRCKFSIITLLCAITWSGTI